MAIPGIPQPQPPPTPTSTIARFGDFELDRRAGELRRGGYRVRLQEKPLQVLLAVLEHPGEVVRRDELRARLWPGETYLDFENNLNTAVSKLREALGDAADSPRYLETLPKRGYRLRVAVDWVGTTAPRARWKRWAASGVAVVTLGSLAWVAASSKSTPGSGAREIALSPHPGAHEAYSQGRYFMAKKSRESVRRSIDAYRRAIDLDPDFAAAYVGLSESLYTFRERPLDVVPQALAAAEQAVALDRDLAAAYHRRGVLRFYFSWDWDGAQSDLARAVRLEPRSSEFHKSYAACFAMRGRHDQALAEISQALDLDPASATVNADAAWYFYTAGRHEEAIAQSRKALALEPQHAWADLYIVLANLAKGDLEPARAWAEKIMIAGHAESELVRELRAGDEATPLRAFWRWQETEMARHDVAGYVAPADRALVAIELGERERALELLEEAQRERGGWVLPFLEVYPQFEPLRDEPRFQALVKRMRYPA